MLEVFQEKYPIGWKEFTKRYVIYSVLLLIMQIIFSEDVYISSYLSANIGLVLGAFIIGGLLSSIIGAAVYFGNKMFGNASSFVFYVERSYLFILITFFVVELITTFIVPV